MTDRATIDAAKANPIVTNTAQVTLDTVHPHPMNARRGDIPTIAESLRRNGQYKPIVANKRDGSILVGNHTYLAAKSIGWSKILVSWVDVDDEQATRILLVDNRSSDMAGYDNDALARLLRELPSEPGGGFRDLEGTGFDKGELDRLDRLINQQAGGDVIPPPDGDGTGYKEQFGVIVICEDETRQQDAFDKLTADGYECKVVTT